MCARRESKLYSELGASSSKEGVASLLGATAHQHFVVLNPDVCGDLNYYSLIHADGAGTKSILSYIAYRETGDLSWFRGLAQDSLVMNLDDVACVGAFESLILSNTIGRNRKLIPDSAIGEIVTGYKNLIEELRSLGIDIKMGGGETADVGDLVRTMIVDSTLFGRVKKSEAISTAAISPGDLIIGVSSTGQANYESAPNSGIGSNGFTLARHAAIGKRYLNKYPEIRDELREDLKGSDNLLEARSDLQGSSIAKALLSPTRTYAPALHKLLNSIDRSTIHGIIHCTGGGQTKIMNFGRNVRYVKDSLFPLPPIFDFIQRTAAVPWSEMYAVFNMGHRLEIVAPEQSAELITDLFKSFNLESKVVGRVEHTEGGNQLSISSPYGKFDY